MASSPSIYDEIVSGEADEVLTQEMAHKQAMKASTARRFQMLREEFLDKNRDSFSSGTMKGGLKKKGGLKSSLKKG